MRKPFALLTLVAVLGASAFAIAGPASAGSATKNVTLRDNYFSPKKVTINKGDKIKFLWGKKGKGTEVDHNVFAQKGDEFRSKDKIKGSYTHKFKKTTTIYCTIHPTTMKMTVKVK